MVSELEGVPAASLREFLLFSAGSLQPVMAWVCVVVEVGVYALLGYWTVLYFDLKLDWDKKSVSSKTGAVKVLLFVIRSSS